MGITTTLADDILEIVIDFPPVNAITVAGWQAIADALRATAARAVVLRAAEAARGFCAGVDLKELQREPHAALVAVNRACAAAFAAVYDCEAPVVAAVHGHCLGGGVGLAGNADLLLAAHDASFGLPEVDRGALGAATHLARLVPQQRLRHMVYTCERASAEELHRHRSVLRVVERAELGAAARALAAQIAAKDPRVVRAAKQSLNGIDPVDVRRSYRFEQGFTFELDLLGAGHEARERFLGLRPAEPAARAATGSGESAMPQRTGARLQAGEAGRRKG